MAPSGENEIANGDRSTDGSECMEQQPPAHSRVAVIVPVYNGGPSFLACLTSLTRLNPPADEIIVVADGDTDGSSELAEAFGLPVVRLPARGGPAHARNVGASVARGDVLFFIDADVVISPDAIGKVESVLRREPDVAAVFGSYDDAPSETDFLSQYKNLLHHYVHQTGAEDASTFWAGCGAIRRTIFLSLGGFDERYHQPSIEDIELGYRLKRAGYAIRLCKTLQGKHLKHWSIYSLLRTDFTQRALPWTDLILQERKLVNDLNLSYSSRASVIAVYGLLGTVAGATLQRQFLFASALLALLLLVLNAPLYRFFWRKRGLSFALQAIPWHWLYYIYGGMALAIGLVHLLLWRRRIVIP